MPTSQVRYLSLTSMAVMSCLQFAASWEAEVAATPPADTESVSPAERLQAGLDADEPRARLGAIARVSVKDVAPDQQSVMIEQLIEALDDEVPDVRALAAETIGLFGDRAKSTVPRLIKQLGDDALTRELRGVWVSASKALAAIGPAALQPMLDTIPHSDRTTYYGITGAIAEMGEAAESAAPLLMERLRNGPENRRWATMFALSKLGDAAAPAIPDFIQQLDHENFNMQVIACRALAALGPAAKPAVPKLLELIETGIVSSRTHAAMCLGAIGPVEDVDSVGILMNMAQEKNAFSQERAMIGLGRLGPHAVAARDLILHLIEQEDFSQKPEAASALWLVTGESQRAMEVLTELIDSPTYDFRVMQVLIEMGPDAHAASDLLALRLDNDDQGVRLLAAKALGSIGPAAAAHVGSLRKHLENSDRDVVAAIEDAIAKIGADLELD